jgi:hypothetical protein
MLYRRERKSNMKVSYINTSSYWGLDFQNEYLQQSSDTLVILFPGNRYTINAPYMHYSYQVAKECGYDILSLEYGFQKANLEMAFSETLELINETTETVQKVLCRKDYKNIICIGKSQKVLFKGPDPNPYESML